MLTIRAMSNGRGYAAHHLVHSDYYAEGQRVVGYWQGRGAAELGLVGEVTEQQFEAIRQGPPSDDRGEAAATAERGPPVGGRRDPEPGAPSVRLHPLGPEVGLDCGRPRRG